MTQTAQLPRLMAGIPAINATLYRRIKFSVGDPVALLEVSLAGKCRSTLILRDIEMDRASQHAAVDNVACPADFEPSGGLSGDRETATAQAVAEFCRRSSIRKVVADRTLPLIFAHVLEDNGIEVVCDIDYGIIERRVKDAREIGLVRQAQADTESVIRLAADLILNATANQSGVLESDGIVLSAEYMQRKIDIWLLELGYSNPGSIVACGPVGADCHHHGEGDLKTGQPIILDVFPKNKSTLYNGDCTRTIVHGEIPAEVAKMHAAVVAAKVAATETTKAGVTGESVHQATIDSIVASGYQMGLPTENDGSEFTSMPHGTGHGIGLEVHEPPLLAESGPELLAGDLVTIEPGLYGKQYGGVRIEDIVLVTDDGAESLNSLPEGLKLD